MTKIGFIGLGAMGLRMATRLNAAGYDLAVYNRSRGPADQLADLGARIADSPREAATDASVVISMVTDDEISSIVWMDEESGALGGMKNGAVAVESSTLTPALSKKLGKAAGKHGIRFLEAPVVGTRPHAERGQLTYLVGGEADTLEAVREVLSIMGAVVHHVGPVGTGMSMKLAVNALFAIQVAALGEVIPALERSGIAKEEAVAILNSLAISSPVAQHIAGRMLEGGFAPNFPIDLVEKDLRYCIEMAKAPGASNPIVQRTGAVYQAAQKRGFGGDDISGIIQQYLKPDVA
ncbi:MAG: NAD(P)-dependent oxidoreductase [Rhodothermales bacterium]